MNVAPVDRTVTPVYSWSRAGLFTYNANFDFRVGADLAPGTTVTIDLTFTGGISSIELVTGHSGWDCTREALSPRMSCTATVSASHELPRLTVTLLLPPRGTWTLVVGGRLERTGTFG